MMEESPVNSPDKITEIAMMEESPVNSPDKIEEIFRNFRGRRAGLIKALTTDFRQVYQQCDPEKECLCLYGLPNETWEVTVPSEMVPPDYPEPVLGINFARDTIPETHWLLEVAFHCDSWLIAVAFYDGAKCKINKPDRNRLFQMINDLPTISEVLRPYANQPNDHSGTHNSSSEIKSTRKDVTRQSKNHTSKPMKMTMPPKEDERGVKESQQPVNHNSMPMMMTMAPKESRQPVNHIIMPWILTMAPMESGQPMNFSSMPMKMTMAPMESRQPVNHTSMPMQMTMAPKEHETRVEVHEVQGITLCGACGKKDGPGEFRICCDTCNKWFHGLCVAMTREDAEHIMHFKCPGCRGKQKQN